MKKVIFEKSILSCVLIFLICCIARVVEYFGIRTDETILAENFIHKVFGIIILVVMLVLSKLSWDSIGFTKTKIVQNVLKGLALGVSCFSIAYLVECVLLYCMNGNVQLSVYTSGFSLNGEAVKQTGIYLLTLLTFPYFQGFPPLKILYMYPFPLFLPLWDNYKGKFIIQLFNRCLPLYQEVLRKSALLPL